MKKNIGYYYSSSLKLILVGFVREGKLHGKVIEDKTYSFYRGYKYNSWNRNEFRYLGHGNPTEVYIALDLCKPHF